MTGLAQAPYAAAVFLGAFLLFQVQPLLAKALLPWFGGAPAVWTTSMLFFQVLLLGGYAYAHLTATRLRPAAQAALHLALVLVSLGFLDILPSAAPAGAGGPAWSILCLLGAKVGPPCLVLAATSPLLQAWCSGADQCREPYRFYALSNAGSLLALLSYPLLCEPFLPLRSQAAVWAGLYAIFALALLWCAASFLRGSPPTEPAEPDSPEDAPRPGLVCFWVVLAACGTVLLLATTSQLTQDVSAAPFLWIGPLVAYLLSFILCFEGGRWYSRPVWTVFLVLAAAGVAYALTSDDDLPLYVQFILYCLTLFVACMVCHGELARRKPPARHLTGFYLAVCAGGALGGVLAAVAAPLVLSGPWEYPLAWLFLCAFMLAILWHEDTGRGRYRLGLLLALYAVFAYALFRHYAQESSSVTAMGRNFYGALQVSRSDFGDAKILVLTHGHIEHGFQFLPPDPRRRRPVSYYGPGTGAGAAVAALRRQAAPRRRPLHMGVVGLGAGVLAAWGRPGDRITFYEINPLVVRFNKEYFSYLRDSAAAVDLVMGDARLSLEREAALRPQPLDLLALDAFTGDAIPLHLLTREAFDVYFRRLRPGGVLAVHVSNLFLDLEPLVRGLAQSSGKAAATISNPRDEFDAVEESDWVLVSADRKLLADPAIRGAARSWPKERATVVFTDQNSSLLRLLRRD